MVDTTRIPGTDMQATRIGLGTWAIGGWMWGGTDEEQSVRTVQKAVDRGISLIDTAPVYGMGTSERFVGEALLENGRRDRVVLATKCGLNWSGSQPYRDARPERIRQEVDDSLQRLRTDVIDIEQVHWPDPNVPVEETAGALKDALQAGKIRAIGVSNFSPEQMDRFRKEAPLSVVQPPYNLFERGVEDDVLAYVREHRLTSLTYGALCRGLLTGKMTPDQTFQGDDLRNMDPKFQGARFQQYVAAVDRLDGFAQERFGKRAIHLALAWVLAQPGVGVALWGARRPDQLDALAEIDGIQLTQDDLAEIDRIVSETVTDPVGPEFMAPPARNQAAA
ncbi:general stress protein [Rhodovibrio sodomensis]|uniref:General stress protein n=1 Tax=Rhodovibrio sodomensis TaxID=1088 RepID=A0ABS1DKI8_9PROT|nr:aldo/keto reductase [Rhodovibrio sodomensis]MBK1670622.1 general stress protein [Rhodovibrio sodomensis]